MLAFGFNRMALLALLLCLFSGVFEQFKGILLGTWLQLKATDDQLIKVYSAQGVLTSLLFGLSTLLAGVFANVFSVQWACLRRIRREVQKFYSILLLFLCLMLLLESFSLL